MMATKNYVFGKEEQGQHSLRNRRQETTNRQEIFNIRGGIAMMHRYLYVGGGGSVVWQM